MRRVGSKPTGSFGDGAGDSRRQRAVARHCDSALLLRVAVDVMFAAVTNQDPTFPYQTENDPAPVRFDCPHREPLF
jgi:hypothetical protein